MKHATTVPCLVLSTLLGAQDGTAPADRVVTPPDHHQAALGDVLGMTVRLRPSPKARAEATSDGRLAKPPTGSIADLVLVANGGESRWAAVSVGGILGIGDRIVAVPCTALVWVVTEGDPVFELRATEAELTDLPTFDPIANNAQSLARVVRASEKAWSAVRPDIRAHPLEASGAKADAPKPTLPDNTWLLATQLMGCKVKSSDNKDFGSIDEACYNLKTHCVDFFVIGTGGMAGIGETDYLVPFDAARMTLVGEDKDAVMTLAHSATALKDATKYVKPDHGLVSEQNGRQACEFYGVSNRPRSVDAATGIDTRRAKN